MASVIDELVILLGIDVNTKSFQTIDKMSEGLQNISKMAMAVGAAITAAASSALYLAERMNRTAAGIGYFSQLTGISTKNVQGLGVALEQIGGDFNAVQADLMALTKTLNSIVPGEFNLPLFQLGVNIRRASGDLKTADEILLDVSDKIHGMPVQEQLQWASRLGFSPDTIRLLQLGRAEIMRLRGEASALPAIIDDKTIQNAQIFTQDMSILRRIMLFLGQEASSSTGPALHGIVRDMEEWIKQNRQLVESGLSTFIEGTIQGFRDFWESLSTLKQKFVELFPGLAEFISKLWNTKFIAALVEGALAAIVVSLGAWLASLTPLIAAITAAGLVINDFIAYVNGGNSVIGEMIKWNSYLEKSFQYTFPNITNLLSTFKEVFKDLGSILKDIVIVSLEKVFGWLSKISGVIGTIFDKVLSFIDNTLGKWGWGPGGEYSDLYRNFYGNAAEQSTLWRAQNTAFQFSGPGLLPQGYKSRPSSKEMKRSMEEGMNFFMSKGFTREQAAGIMGNLAHESGLNAAAVGDSGRSFGIAQWRDERRNALYRFARENGLNPKEYQTQLMFVMRELETTENATYRALMTAKTPESAAQIFSKGFERPGNPMMASRIGYAQEAMKSAMTEIPIDEMFGPKDISTQNNVTITQHIHGTDSSEIADRAAKRINYNLQQNYPGSFAPAAS